MRRGLLETMFRHAGALTAEDRIGSATDAALFRSYQAVGNPATFAALAHRHGPMVWSVCRNTLGEADADDAFQATFLALIRSGYTIRDPASVGRWLHRVTVQICIRSKEKSPGSVMPGRPCPRQPVF
jgi:hypothetical protein